MDVGSNPCSKSIEDARPPVKVGWKGACTAPPSGAVLVSGKIWSAAFVVCTASVANATMHIRNRFEHIPGMLLVTSESGLHFETRR